MTSISTVFSERGTGPYGKALKVRVVAVEGKPHNYRAKDGTEKSVLTSAMSDGGRIVKAVCYDSTKFPKFKVGNTLVLRDIIRRTEDTVQAVIVTKATKVLMSAPIEVPDSHLTDGNRLVSPLPAEEVQIKTALSSPLKTRVSVAGKIVQEDEPRQVKVRGSEVTIKTVTVEDATGKAKVTLWREMAESPVRPGDHVKIMDVVVNTYNNVTTLQTTMTSTVEKCDAPMQNMDVEVEAIGLEDGSVELFLDSGESMSVPAAMLQRALGLNSLEEVELATMTGNLKLNISVRGSDTVEIVKQ